MVGNDTLDAARAQLVTQLETRGEMEPEQAVTPEPSQPNGPPPNRTEADVLHIKEARFRHLAIQEYNKTLEEFRQTGAVPDKEWDDFSQFRELPTQHSYAFNAYCDAAVDLKNWLDEQAEDQPEPSIAGTGTALIAPATPPAIAKRAGLLRGVVFDPDAPGRNAAFEPAIPQLEVAPQPERLPDLDDQTEGLLNGLIAECHFLMREVAFPSMCHAQVADDRLYWVSKAMDLAKTGAGVAKAVARLRHGPKIKETRQTFVVENKVVAMAQGGGG